MNSRNTADEDVVRTLASMAGFAPSIAHRVDSLDLVQDLIRARLGVGLLPLDQPTHPEVVVLPLREPKVTLRAYTAIRRGRSTTGPPWPSCSIHCRAGPRPVNRDAMALRSSNSSLGRCRHPHVRMPA